MQLNFRKHTEDRSASGRKRIQRVDTCAAVLESTPNAFQPLSSATATRARRLTKRAMSVRDPAKALEARRQDLIAKGEITPSEISTKSSEVSESQNEQSQEAESSSPKYVRISCLATITIYLLFHSIGQNLHQEP